MEQKLAGKVAFITGGNSGIGLATARLFVDHGAKVIVTGTNQKTLDEARSAIGESLLAIKANVGDLSQLDSAFAAGVKAFGKIDVVFANAGIGTFMPMSSITEAAFDDIMRVNVKGVFFTVQRAVPHLNEHASIILNSSFLSYAGLANSSVLSASKAAVISFGRTFAAELAPLGVRVNSISPGFIATPFVSRTGLPSEVTDGIATMALSMTPLKRFGKPEEIAKVVLFLASEDSSYIVGSDLLADGGVVYA
jgi:NAD(P)-dependent dehydrogenase (short-subunit alcohol dehydrogenase family)